MKRKRILLVCIILLPGLVYFLFELTQANFKKMAYYGPKTLDAKGDTVYYKVPNFYFDRNLRSLFGSSSSDGSVGETSGLPLYRADTLVIDTANYPVYVILFLDSKLRMDGYKLEALFDYVQYKPDEFKNIPIFFVSNLTDALNNKITNKELKGDFDSLKINLPNFHPLLIEGKEAKEAYFNQKPYYVFNYFAVLVDKHRHIRGYYDPNQNSEIKRLLQEYKHVKTKDEYANTLKQNELEQKK